MIPIRDNNPTIRPPVVTISLIVVCVAVHLWQISLDQRAGELAIYQFGFVPALLFGDAYLSEEIALLPPTATLFTSMFLHGDFMHLGGNMLYLWVFGNNIEDSMGHGRFIFFYLIAGLAAAFAQALPDPASSIPMIGASGAISGVLGGYLLLFPHARVQVLVPVIILLLYEIRAGWLLGFWFLFQVLSGISSGDAEGGVAWWAHVGGFVAGMALIHLFRERTSAKPARPGRSKLPSVGMEERARRPGPWDRR